MRVLVAGATGYVGSRLVPRLLAAGHTVRCLARDPGRLRDRPWAGDVEIVRGDVLDRASLDPAMGGADVVHYLVHSLASRGFAATDRRAATQVAAAAADAGVGRIVYLGGLHPPDTAGLSDHLASRTEVGRVFLDGPVPAVVLQAGVIVGSGSASFEMLRYLTERLPASVTPRWVHTRTQPIAIRDVLTYLVAATNLPGEPNRTFDVGGPDVLTYADMMRGYARVAGLPRRLIVPVPLLTPRLSGHWVNLVTPVPRSIAMPLIESLEYEAICTEDDLRQLLPGPVDPTPYERAVELALAHVRDPGAERHRSATTPAGAPSDPLPSDPSWSGGSVRTDERSMWCAVPPERLWRVVEGIGDEPGRWRIETVEPGRLLRLHPRTRLPGDAWLELSVAPEAGGSVYRQRAVFVPRGLTGQLAWWVLRPFHGVILGGMARAVTRAG